MEFEGTFTVDAPRQDVFERMQEPEMLEQTIPNCTEVERRSETEYRAYVTEKISRISLDLENDVELTELREPEYVEITLSGTSPSGNTSAEGVGQFTLSEAADSAQTTIDYDFTIDVSGKLASLGFRMMKHTVNKRIDQMVTNIQEAFETEDATVT